LILFSSARRWSQVEGSLALVPLQVAQAPAQAS
jgi:hypothetical protein